MSRRASLSRPARFVVALAVLLLASSASDAAAYRARVGWEPVQDAAGYLLYVRYGQQSFAAPIDLGLVGPEADGVVRAIVSGLPLGPTATFAVKAYDSAEVSSGFSNMLEVSYADAAAVVDSDGDGLSDAEEDSNLDGVVDSGETDPNNGDSDGDGVSDGDEVAAGTDPTSPTGSGFCGDGSIDPGEQCDDGNASADDGCLPDCRLAACVPGDGSCDDGNVCTDDFCSDGECRIGANRASCDDAIACTGNDRCSSGICSGVDICASGLTCNRTTGVCEEAAARNRYLPAATYPLSLFKGAMTTGDRFAGGDDDDPFADSLVPLLVYPASENNAFDGGSGDETIYTVTLGEAGVWHLWGRFYYPGTGNDANSFLVSIDGGAPLKFGNNRDFFRRWHWDGDGAVQSGSRTPLELGYLEAGTHQLVVEKRESSALPPRLDVLFLTLDGARAPDDGDALAELDVCPDGVCGPPVGNALCGDASGNGTVSIADAWTILNAGVGLADVCSFAVCDVDADNTVAATDAVQVLNVAVGVEVPLNCSPTIGFAVRDAIQLDSLEFLVDYGQAGVEFEDGQAAVHCGPVLTAKTTDVVAINDAGSKLLSVKVEFLAPIDGDAGVAECRFYSDLGVLPTADAIDVSVVGYTSPGGTNGKAPPAVSASLVLP